MRIVAIRTNNLAFTDGVAVRTVNQLAHLLMAVKANLRLRVAVAHFVLFGMNGVAGRACDIAIRVGAARPMHALAALMAC